MRIYYFQLSIQGVKYNGLHPVEYKPEVNKTNLNKYRLINRIDNMDSQRVSV